MEPYTLTKTDIAALRSATYVVVWYYRDPSKCAAHAVKEWPRTERNPFEREDRYIIEAPVTLYCYESSGLISETPDQVTAVASARLWHDQQQSYPSTASSIVRLLKAGDAIVFQFEADAKTTNGLRDATPRFHGDVLQILVWRGKQRFSLPLVTAVCPNNTARMVRGLTESQRKIVAA